MPVSSLPTVRPTVDFYFAVNISNAASSRDYEAGRGCFKDNAKLGPPEVENVCEMCFSSSSVFFISKYFSPLINVSLHPKFSFSIYLAQTFREEENKAGRKERWQEPQTEMRGR